MVNKIVITLPNFITSKNIDDDVIFELMDTQEIITLEPSWKFRNNQMIIEPIDGHLASESEIASLIEHFRDGLQKVYEQL